MNQRRLRLCRGIFLVWLLAFVLVVAFSLSDTGWDGRSPSILSLFIQPPAAAPAAPVATTAIAEPQPEPKPAATPAPKPEPVRNVLARGRKTGSGSLGIPHATNAQDAATIAIPYRGTLGEYQAFRAHNVNSWCIDLQGDWKPWEGTVRPSGSGIATSVQVGRHKGWARISMVASDPRAVLKEEITYTADTLFIRIARAQDQNQGRGQAASAPAARPQAGAQRHRR
ncbi:MAG: hypothetical protein K6E40_11775 [Desulfovibrio sp.]|nr:hypothetical protein [Desulfovibrio sp.]